MNTDPRGFKRGNCLAENCDCVLYEYEESTGSKCSYCYCPPTKHQRIEVVEAPVQITPESGADAQVIDASSNNGDSQEQTYIIQDLIPVSSNVIASQLCSPQLQGLLPKKLPKHVEMALESKSLTPVLRNRIVRVVADKCFEENISSKAIDDVAEMAVQKWSPLKSRFGDSQSSGFAKQIRRRLSKLRMHSKKIPKDTSTENSELEETYAFNKEQMVLEMGKNIPSATKLKQFLDATRALRTKEVNHNPALDIMALYPALKKPDLLLWEFTQLVNVSEDILIQRWKEFITGMTSYLKRTENFTPVAESYEGLTLDIYMKLPSLLPSGKRTNDIKKVILQNFKDNKSMDDVTPVRTDPPRLIAIGNLQKDVTLFAYVDGVAIFAEKCPIKAVLLLLSTYWVFNIEFIPESRPSFLLISTAILKEEMPKSRLSKCSAVHCLWKQLDL